MTATSSTLKLSLLISADGASRAAKDVLAVRDAARQLSSQSKDFAELAQTMGVGYKEAKRFAEGLGLSAENTKKAYLEMRLLNTVGADVATKWSVASESLGLNVKQFDALEKAAQKSIGQASQQTSIFGDGISGLAFRFNSVLTALQTLAAAAGPAYDLMIGANERLNQQILSSQTNLASSSRLFEGGEEITDPISKINASKSAIQAALKQVEKDTQKLVGVTSSEVNELFQITLTNAATINNQSKQFPDSIQAATSLTKGWAASLKVIGVPLFQARQEINSILKGQIDNNSILAKNLDISSEQVRQWKSQGILVDELNKRLDVFVAGNAIAARSIDGISSNIKDLVERIGREAGQPLLEPLIDALAEIEKYISANEAAITLFFGRLIDTGIDVGSALGDAFGPLGKSLLELGEEIGPIALGSLENMAAIVVSLAAAIGPLADILALLIDLLAKFAGTDLGGIIIQATLLTAVMAKLGATILPLAAQTLPLLGKQLAVLATQSIPQAIAGLGSAATAANAGLSTLAAGGIPAAIAGLQSMAVAAAPIAGILAAIAGAVVVTFLIKGAKDLQNAREEMELLQPATSNLSDEALHYSGKLKALAEQQKKNGSLTAEQAKQQAGYRNLAKQTIKAIDEQIATYKEIKVPAGEAGDAQRRGIEATISGLEAQKELLDKNAGGLVIQGKELAKLGTTAEQYAKKVEDAQRSVANEGQGDAKVFGDAAKEVVGLTQSQVKLGQITVEEGKKRLEAIRDNVKVEVATQQQAADAIVAIVKSRIEKIAELENSGATTNDAAIDELEKIRTDETLKYEARKAAADKILELKKETSDAELAENKASQALLKQQQAEGALSEAAAEKALTQLKVEEAQKRQEELGRQIQFETDPEAKAKLVAEEKAIAAEIGTIRAEGAEKDKKRAVEQYNSELAVVEASYAKKTTSETAYQAKRTEILSKQADEEIKQLQEKLGKLAATDTAGRGKLLGEIAKVEKRKADLVEEAAERERKVELENYDERLAIAEASYSKSELSEAEYLSKRTELRQQQADTEIRQLNEQLKKLAEGDIEGREALLAKIAKVEKRKSDIQAEAVQERLSLLKSEQDKARALLEKTATETEAQLQGLINSQSITQEEADKRRIASKRKQVAEEIELAKELETSLANQDTTGFNPKQQREFEKQKLDAARSTSQAVLELAKIEADEIERVRSLAIKAIEREVAAADRRNRAVVSGLKNEEAARKRTAAAAEAAVAAEVRAADEITKSLERQNNLLTARANLQKAQNDADQSSTQIGIDRLSRAIEIQKSLADENLSAQERVALERELGALGINRGQSVVALVKQQQQLEDILATQKREALLSEQQQQIAALALDQQRNEAASRRAEIEGRINQLKAEQAILDAKSAARQQELADKQRLREAQAALKKADKLGPGAERDEAIAEAQADIAEAKSDSQRNAADAAQSIDLAEQQAAAAQETSKALAEDKVAQAEINRLSKEALEVQQASALKQFEAAEAARQQAQALALARVEAELIAAASERAAAAQGGGREIPGRRMGGDAIAGNQYRVGEEGMEMVRTPSGDHLVGVNGPEIIKMVETGHVFTAAETAKMLQGLDYQIAGVPLPQGIQDGAAAIVAEVRQLRTDIGKRPPANVQMHNHFTQPDSNHWDQQLRLERSIARTGGIN